VSEAFDRWRRPFRARNHGRPKVSLAGLGTESVAQPRPQPSLPLRAVVPMAQPRPLSTDVLMALGSRHLIFLINGGTTYDLTPTLHASPNTMIPRISTVISMWRALAGTTARVALVFKIPLTEDPAASLNLLMIPVAYHTDAAVERELKSVVKNIKDNQQFLRSSSMRCTGEKIAPDADDAAGKGQGIQEQKKRQSDLAVFPAALNQAHCQPVGRLAKVHEHCSGTMRARYPPS
jgi:hypothetical protein